MKDNLTKLEKKWILYDVGNSAFTLLVSTIVPIYFNYLAERAGISSVNYMAYWGYALSISTLIVAILWPTLGTLSDLEHWKDFSVFPGHRRRRLCSAGRFNVVDLVPGYLYSGEIRILTEPCPL